MSKRCSTNWKMGIIGTKLEQSQEQAEKKRLRAMSKEVGKSEGETKGKGSLKTKA